MTMILVTGASRGLGLEFVRQYAAAGWDVIACCRNPPAATALARVAAEFPGRMRVEGLDVTDHRAVDALAEKYRGVPIDILVNNAGDIGPRGPNRERLPQQLFGTMNYPEWRRVIEVNTIAPLKVAEAFAANVESGSGRKMIFISSTTGSNVEGTYPVMAYCSSKAALNKVVTMLAMVLRPRGVIAAAVCPGHVKTDLGGPDAAVEVADSIAGLRRVIAGLTLAESGTFTRYDGTRIAW